MRAIFVEYQNKKITLKELSEKTGVKYQTIIGRYHRGKQGNDLVSPAKNKTPKLYNYNGKPLTMEKIASVTGKTISKVRTCYYRFGHFKFLNRPDQKTAKAKVLCTIKGVKYKASDLTRMFGISRQAVSIQYHKKNEKEFINWVLKRQEKQKAPNHAKTKKTK